MAGIIEKNGKQLIRASFKSFLEHFKLKNRCYFHNYTGKIVPSNNIVCFPENRKKALFSIYSSASRSSAVVLSTALLVSEVKY